jgi:hypothetical protein
MTIDSRQIFATLQGYAASSGLFDAVVGHEPIKSPAAPTGLTCAVQYMGMRPIQSSGLNSVSVRVEMWFRIFTSSLQEPQDDIDPRVMDAVDSLFSSVINDFDFGSQARYVDVFGSDGEGMSVSAGFVTMDQRPMRTADIVVPILINDAYDESA